MEQIAKLKLISEHMHLEPAEETIVSPTPHPSQVAPCGQVLPQVAKQIPKESIPIFQAKLPDGKTVPLLKTMLTTACERNCFYCPFRAGRNYRRETFKPEELAKTFMDIHRAGAVDGLFLSSGILNGGVATQDRLLDTADILRHKFHFRGYLHLKMMPGAERDQILRGMQLADRLSVNLEAPNAERLQMLAPKKHFMEELLRPLQIVHELRQTLPAHQGWNGRWPSTTTQFVVGGAGESDLELLFISELLIKKLNLQRIYYSPFNPVHDTPLENLPPEDPMRQHRLYQTSFLFRDYGYELEEMPFDANGNLPLNQDPKLAWAKEHLLHEPVEVNRAAPQSLLRVPGIGPKGAARIIHARRRGTLRELRDLQIIGVQTKRLESFVLLDGKRPFRQLPLFE